MARPRAGVTNTPFSSTMPHPIAETTLRSATPSDCSAIVALVESAYRGEASRAGWTTEADLLDGQRTDPEEVSSLMANPEARLIVAERGGQLVGNVLVRREGDSAYIGMLAVAPQLQADGLGRRLLTHAEEVAITTFGLHHAHMTVIVQREALIAWYVRRGYVVTPHREPFPYGNPRFGLPQRPDLEFVVLTHALG
jgi:ribosomal protein S18 acetylase RimI-like enzyme